MEKNTKRDKGLRRQKRVRAKMFGTAQKPRLSVFRSAKHIYGQLVDDEKGRVIVSASDKEIKKGKVKSKEGELAGKKAVAFQLGENLAKKALEKKIERIIFDRGRYQYHGRVKALAEGAREGGLKF